MRKSGPAADIQHFLLRRIADVPRYQAKQMLRLRGNVERMITSGKTD